MQTPSRSRYDAVIVGTRCAGAATAMLLARQGLNVLAIDRTRHGSDTLSTHALMRGGVLQLHRWGVLDAIKAAGTPAVSTTTFHYGEESVEVAIKPRDGVDALYAPRRTVLDAVLADAAAEAGAEIVRGPRLVDLTRTPDGRVAGALIEGPQGSVREIAADLVVGADGARSTVAGLVAAPITHQRPEATGVVYGYFEGLPLTGYHWLFQPGVSAGAITTNGGTLIFSSVSQERFWREIRFDLVEGFHKVLRENDPSLADAVRCAKQVGGLRGYAGRPGYLRQCRGPGWALVGDAGYFKDPITAHGITDALRDAELLSAAVSSGDSEALDNYWKTRDQLSLRLFEITADIASFNWNFLELQRLHKEMSEEMKREVNHLLGLAGRQPARMVCGSAG